MTPRPHTTVLIADDEPPARRRLAELLAGRPDVTVVAECGNGVETVRAIRERRPTVVFLDVQMPDLDGFGVVEEVGPAAMPAVVFVTAFDRYALRAFEVHALDYLLKPFGDDRFHAALDRAQTHVDRRALESLGRRLGRLLRTDTRKRRDRLIPVRTAGRVELVDLDEVHWIEGAGSYSRLHLESRTHLVRASLGSFARRYAGELLRIHRSTVVSRREIVEVRRRSHGDAIVVLRDGTELRASRRYRADLRHVLAPPGSV